MQMHLHRDLSLGGIDRDFLQSLISHRIGSVRREDDIEAVVGPVVIPQRQPFLQGVLAVAAPGSGGVNYGESYLCPYAGFASDLSGVLGEEILVGECRCSRAEHLCHGEPGPVGDKARRYPFLLGRPDMLLQPLHQGFVVCIAPQQGHGCVGVGIDQPRNQRVSVEVDDLIGPITFLRLC